MALPQFTTRYFNMVEPLITNRFIINGTLSFRDSIPNDGVSYTYNPLTDAYEPAKVGVPSYAYGWFDLSDVVVDGDTITIGGRSYELNVSSTAAGTSDSTIDLTTVSTVDTQIAAIVAHLNADPLCPVTASGNATLDSIFVYAKTPGSAGNAITLAETLTNGVASGETLVDGSDDVSVQVLAFRHTITAAEAAAGAIRVLTRFSTIKSVVLGFEDAGVVAAAGTTMTITNAAGASSVLIAEGTPAWANNDVMNIVVFGK